MTYELVAIFVLVAIIIYLRVTISRQEKMIEFFGTYQSSLTQFMASLREEGVDGADPHDLLNWAITLVDSEPLPECPEYVREVVTEDGARNDMFGSVQLISEQNLTILIITGVRMHRPWGHVYVPMDIVYHELSDGRILRLEAIMEADRWEEEVFEILPRRGMSEWQTISDSEAEHLLQKFGLADV